MHQWLINFFLKDRNKNHSEILQIALLLQTSPCLLSQTECIISGNVGVCVNRVTTNPEHFSLPLRIMEVHLASHFIPPNG